MATSAPVRIYVGGLPEDVTAQELHERFGSFVRNSSNCQLTNVELPTSKLPENSVVAGKICRGFAYLTLQGANATTQSESLQKTFNRTKWRGKVLKVQVAKPHFTRKLEQERQERTLARKRLEEERRAWQTHISTPAEQVKPLKLAVSFKGRKNTDFLEVSVVEQEAQDEAKTATHAEDSKDESTAASESQDDDEKEALDENDVEAFVRQVEEEACATKQDAKSNVLSREEMNARRLQALEVKQKQKQKEKMKVIIPALGEGVCNKKITFDDSGNEEDPKQQGEENDEVITNWMDSSDEETYRDGNERTAHETVDFTDTDEAGTAEALAAFAVRPEFVGERGKRLFEMQKRFGGDSRFRLDARFLEEETNEFGGNNVDNKDEHNKDALTALQNFLEEEDPEEAARHAREMHEEEEAALRVLSYLFPNIDVTRLQRRMQQKRERKDSLKEAAWMGELKRYDPRDMSSRREFEIPMTVASSRVEKDDAKPSASAHTKKDMPTGGDRFFSTSSNLSNLFSRVRKNSEDGEEGEAALDGVFGLQPTNETDSSTCFKLSSLFSFPAGEDKPLAAMADELLEDENEVAPSAENGMSMCPRDTNDQGDDALTTDSEAGDETEEEQTQTDLTRKRVKKSLEDFLRFGRTFVGGGEIENWPECRKKLTLDYKRKRRDAIKMKKRQNIQHHKSKPKTDTNSTAGTSASSKWKKARALS
ncbi:hypothetical protein PsorP6_010552 [Peronosclerospora sorghi]|uniref:Uncharacterized protein n=1 Tax=Peronosclerospora sorghi TaxID=230839 RepID=A0ACC0VYZ3_9STRA|nr:hypothetical protein PsorP6_010552 [Peronosclerospora sorghi]